MDDRFKLYAGLIVGAAVVASILLAYLLPATYVSEVSIQIAEPPGGKPKNHKLPPAHESAQKLEDALLTRSQLEKIAQTAPTKPNEAEQSAIRASSEIRETGPNTLLLSVSTSSAEQAQYFAAQLAKRAVELAPRVLGSNASEKARAESVLDQRLRELATFVREHPEVSEEADGQAPNKDAPQNDSTIRLLRYERDRVEAELQQILNKPPPSDNPYAEPKADPTALKRRLADLKLAIEMREKALAKPAEGAPVVTPAPTPELLAEWKQKLKAVSEAQKSRDSSDPHLDPAAVLSARIIADATLPKTPLKPNRPLVILLGTFAGILIAGSWWTGRTLLNKTEPGLPSTSEAPPPEPAFVAQGPEQGTQPAASPFISAFAAQGSSPVSPVPPSPAPDEKPAPEARRGFWHGAPPPHFATQAFVTTADEPQVQHLLPAKAGGDAANGSPGTREDLTPPQSFSVQNSTGPNAVTSGGGVTEVNLPLQAGQEVVEPKQPEPRRQRRAPITQALGSMVAPDVSERSNHNKAERPSTTYSYSSNPPPAPAPSAELVMPSEAHEQQPVSHSRVITCVDVPNTWHPDPSLFPLSSFATLRDTLYQLALGRCYVVLVTSSPEHRRQKSRMAAQVALALAESGHPRVLLIESDFDRPLVSRTLGIDMPPGQGFSQQLHARIRNDASPIWTVVRCVPTLHVLGETSVRTPGMLLSVQFDAAITELRTHYDLIVIDAPPTNLDMDMRALNAVCDGVVIAAPGGAASVAQAERNLGVFGEKSLRAIVPTDA